MSASIKRKIAGYTFAVAFIIAGWWITAVILDSPALPTPIDTFWVIGNNFAKLMPDLAISTYRVVVSMVIAVVIAAPLAMLCSRSKRVDAFFAPTVYLLYPIPKVVILPILLVLFGLGDAPKIVLISLTVFFQVLIAVRDGVKAVPEDAVESVRTLGASRWDIFRHVVFPATLPSVFTSLRIATGTSIAVLFFAEAIAGSTGIGYFIMQSWAMVDYTRMFAGIIALSVLGIALYAIFDIAERKATRWRR